MNRLVHFSCRHIFAGGLALGLIVPFAGAHADDITVYTFSGGNDGANPPCGLISGGKGISPATGGFYGVTEAGGANGYGTVFHVQSEGFETVLHSFTGGSDGAYPVASLVADATVGNLYGTTEQGGAYGFGVVFKLTPGGTETVLYSFTGGSDGAYPVASLIRDKAGNLYGTTEEGGASGDGVVFKVTPGGTESVLHSFGGSDGAFPVASVIMDGSGNLYGTTAEGGAGNLGVVFKLAPGDSESVLHSFAGGSDGASPVAGVIMDKAQNLYGTTRDGGSGNAGTVFRLTRTNKETILHAFAGGSDGAYPLSAVTEASGTLYGTTSMGGGSDAGVVFKTPAKGGGDTVLHAFTGGSDGGLPEGGVVDVSGNLFGTTFSGGNIGCFDGDGCGVVFEITP
jgi:uncharacterized repeat protein (TIGR03803 family)